MTNYSPVIGLEVHIELNTVTKMFCACPADHFAKKPNTQTCPICLGLPGALPFANQAAIDDTIIFANAFDCQIAMFSKFDRKHYFYPDLPKGYQISQYDLPIAKSGLYKKSGKNFRIRRIHLEEDTAKLVHQEVRGKQSSLIDFNRSGVPLVEMVTEPDFQDPLYAIEFLRETQKIVRYLDISTADMEKGSMRLEANLSLRKHGDKKLPDYKIELKNINSFRFLDKALKYEITRQSELLNNGQKVVQETRGFNESKGETFSQRLKEEAQDYRYFPEPDIPPIDITKDKVKSLLSQIPELPEAKRIRYKKQFGLPDNYINELTSQRVRAEYFEAAVIQGLKHEISVKKIADAIVNLKLDLKYTPGGLIKKLKEASEQVFIEQDQVVIAIREVLSKEKKAVESYNEGKIAVLGYLIGQVQRNLKGAGEPITIRKLLLEKLENKVK